jgi:TPR repeat protein
MLALSLLFAVQAAAPSASASASVQITTRDEALTQAAAANQGLSVVSALDTVTAATEIASGSTPQQTVQELRQSADNGNPCALLRASQIERQLLKNPAAAQRDLTQAVTLGCPDARYELASGLVRDRADTTVAVRLLEEAVAYGDPRAATLLGRMYQAGRIGSVDLDRAARNFRAAASAGDAGAQSELSGLLRNRYQASPSRGLLREAFFWSLVAAQRGGDAAAAVAREMLDQAQLKLSRGEIARLTGAAARFRPSTITAAGN